MLFLISIIWNTLSVVEYDITYLYRINRPNEIKKLEKDRALLNGDSQDVISHDNQDILTRNSRVTMQHQVAVEMDFHVYFVDFECQPSLHLDDNPELHPEYHQVEEMMLWDISVTK